MQAPARVFTRGAGSQAPGDNASRKPFKDRTGHLVPFCIQVQHCHHTQNSAAHDVAQRVSWSMPRTDKIDLYSADPAAAPSAFLRIDTCTSTRQFWNLKTYKSMDTPSYPFTWQVSPCITQHVSTSKDESHPLDKPYRSNMSVLIFQNPDLPVCQKGHLLPIQIPARRANSAITPKPAHGAIGRRSAASGSLECNRPQGWEMWSNPPLAFGLPSLRLVAGLGHTVKSIPQETTELPPRLSNVRCTA